MKQESNDALAEKGHQSPDHQSPDHGEKCEKPAETEEQITMWDMVEMVLSEDPGTREVSMVEKLVPWFAARSTFFGSLEKGKSVMITVET